LPLTWMAATFFLTLSRRSALREAVLPGGRAAAVALVSDMGKPSGADLRGLP